MSRSRQTRSSSDAIAKALPVEAMLKAAIPSLREDDWSKAAQTMEGKAGSQYKIKYLNGNNNRNFLVTHKDSGAEFILQYASTSAESEKGLEKLGKLGGLANVYASKTQDLNLSKNEARTYSGEPLVALRVMEKCAGSVNSIADNSRAKGEDPYILAAAVAKQVSAFLTDLSKRDFIWTDLKVGNLLLRDNKELVVADTKAIFQANAIQNRGGKANFTDVTETYLSRAFVDQLQGQTINYADRKIAFEREYSYQLGMVLYTIATGKEVMTCAATSNSHNSKGRDEKPHWGPYFNTDKGKELRYLIERLTDPNPAKRMSHDMAVSFLKDSPALSAAAKGAKMVPHPPEKAPALSKASTALPNAKQLSTKQDPLVAATVKQIQASSIPQAPAPPKASPIPKGVPIPKGIPIPTAVPIKPKGTLKDQLNAKAGQLKAVVKSAAASSPSIPKQAAPTAISTAEMRKKEADDYKRHAANARTPIKRLPSIKTDVTINKPPSTTPRPGS